MNNYLMGCISRVFFHHMPFKSGMPNGRHEPEQNVMFKEINSLSWAETRSYVVAIYNLKGSQINSRSII